MKWLFLLIQFVSYSSYCQVKLSKEEIISIWKNENSKFTWSSHLNKLIQNDSLLTFSQRYLTEFLSLHENAGFYIVITDSNSNIKSCEIGYPRLVCYLFWKDSDKIYIQNIDNFSKGEVAEYSNCSFFNFYNKNTNIINNEIIMPVIQSAEKVNNKISYKIITTSHENTYMVYCKTPISNKLLVFNEGDIMNSKGIFYSQNIKSKSYQWVSGIKMDISR